MNKKLRKLDELHQNKIIRSIDLELCRFFCDLHPDISHEVLLGACLVSHLYGQGHVCLPLDEYAEQNIFEEDTTDLRAPDLESWKNKLEGSPIVGRPGDYRPLILDQKNRLYLHKLWIYEQGLADTLKRKGQQKVDVDTELLKDGLDRLFENSTEQPDWQQVAAASSVRNKLSIISGGPGTGKTSTVVRVLALLLEQHQQQDNTLNIALAAPTGKATARLQESILDAKAQLDVSEQIRKAIPEEVRTLHQLLGASRNSSQFRHNTDNPIPYDLVIVDEASMVDQALMSKLTAALLDDARLILLGDKDQLASVEAGSVLGDICELDKNQLSAEMGEWLSALSLEVRDTSIIAQPKILTDNITLLTKSYRFDEKSGIGRLGKAVNEGEAEEALSILTDDDFQDTQLIAVNNPKALQAELANNIASYFRAIVEAASPEKALSAFNKFRLLAAHRRGPWGIQNINLIIEGLLRKQGLVPTNATWYPGKPVLITTNNYALELFNGDTGLCLPDEKGEMVIYFNGEHGVRTINPNRLPEYETAYAMTVHKSQGSEFDEVMLVLPREHSKVVSRELIYTALTRARTKISIASSKTMLVAGIQKQIRRSSGLRDHLWG